MGCWTRCAGRCLGVVLGVLVGAASLIAQPPCDPPLARRDTVVVTATHLEGGASVTVVADPLANDSSASGLPLTLRYPPQNPSAVCRTTGVTADGAGRLRLTASAATLPFFACYEALEGGRSSGEQQVLVASAWVSYQEAVAISDEFTVERGLVDTQLDVLANDPLPPGVYGSLVNLQLGPGTPSFVTVEVVGSVAGPEVRFRVSSLSWVGDVHFQYTSEVNGQQAVGQVVVHVVEPPPNVQLPYACFQFVERHPYPHWLGSESAPFDTEGQLALPLDRGCSHNGTGPGNFPSEYCWQFGDEPGDFAADGCNNQAANRGGSVCGAWTGCLVGPPQGPQTCTGCLRWYTTRETHWYNAPGDYVVRLKVARGSGASKVWGPWNEKPIRIANAPPTALLEPPTCFRYTCSFSAAGSVDDFDTGSLAYQWSFGDNSSGATGATVSHTFPAFGTYEVLLIATDTVGASDLNLVTVDVRDAPPQAHIGFAGCDGLTCAFNAANSVDDFGLTAYQWSARSVATGQLTYLGQGTTATFHAPAAGLWDVELTVTDTVGQTHRVTQRVNPFHDLTAVTDWVVLPPGASSVTVPVLANDFAPAGASLTLGSFTSGSHGAVTQSGNQLVYTLTGGRPTATDTFPYAIVGSNGQVAEGLVKVVPTAVGEVGRIPSLTSTTQTVSFTRDYGAPPLVFVQPVSRNGAEPAIARILDVRPNGFTVRLEEPAGAYDGTHEAEAADYLVILPPGPGTGGLETVSGSFEDGTPFYAGRVTTSASGPALGDGLERWAWVSLPRGMFAKGSVVLAQTQSSIDPAWVSARLDAGGEGSFRLAIQGPEASPSHGAETVAWLAVAPNRVEAQGELTESGFASLGGAFSHLVFQHNYPRPPLLLASVGTSREADPVVLRHQLLTPGGVELRLDEETTRDAEVAHLAERVGYLAFQGPAVLGGSFRTLSSEGGALVGEDDAVGTVPNKVLPIAVLANDRGLAGRTLAIVGVSPAGYGTVQVGAGGQSVIYQATSSPPLPPPPLDAGTVEPEPWLDRFTYWLSDGVGPAIEVTVTVTVDPTGAGEEL